MSTWQHNTCLAFTNIIMIYLVGVCYELIVQWTCVFN
jgi:hypothetical protein